MAYAGFTDASKDMECFGQISHPMLWQDSLSEVLILTRYWSLALCYWHLGHLLVFPSPPMLCSKSAALSTFRLMSAMHTKS